MKLRNILTHFTLLLFFFIFQIIYVAATDRNFLSDYTQTRYDINNGLLSNESNDVLQTRDGHVWVGSYAGLMRFDGQNFQLMRMDDGTAITRVRTLFEDSRGRLWIGTNNLGLLVYEQGKFAKKAEETAISIRDIVEDTVGNIYIGSSEGIKRIDANDTFNTIDDSRLQDCLVTSLSVSPDGMVWGVTFSGDVFSVVNDEIVAYYPAASFAGLTSNTIYCSKEGQVYVGTTGNVLLAMHNGVFEQYKTGDEKNIASIYHDKSGHVWICTDTGMGYFDKSMTYHTVKGGMVRSSLEKMWQDYEYNYWISSSREGLLHLVHSKFRNITFSGNLIPNVYNANQVYQNDLYLGAENGLYILDKNENRIENDLTRLLTGIRIRDFMVDTNGYLWIATYKNHGVIRYKDGEWKQWTTTDGLTSEKVRIVLQKKDGTIVVGTGDGINFIRGDAVVKTYTRKDGLNNGVILSMIEDADGVIWAGSDGDGVYKILPDGSVTHLNDADNGTKLGTVLHMKQNEKDGTIWISNGYSLYYADKDGLHSITAKSLDLTNIFDIKLIGRDVWLLRSTGIYVVDADALRSSAVSQFSFFKYSDTFHSMLTANSNNMLTPEGYLYLSCSRGVLGIDTSKIYYNDFPPKIAINRIIVDSESGSSTEYQVGDKLVLPSNTTRVTIRFAALSLTGEEARIEYYMDGFDRKPVEVTGKNVYEASYTNLKGGKYSLHVKAWNGDGIASIKELVLPIEKERSFFELPVVQLVLILMGAILFVFVGHNYRQAKLKRQVHQAEAKQKEYQTITDEAIYAIANTIDAKDKYTDGHSKRVAQYSRALAKALGFPEDKVEKVYLTALLHDIGKIGIPDQILNKPGKLTDEEYAVIKEHTNIGYRILKNMDIIPYIKDGAHYHHERYDGKGYPKGLSAEDIPLIARIICVADSFDAMYSQRIYRPKFSINYIRQELKDCSGSQFDPVIAATMLKLIEEGILDNDNNEDSHDDDKRDGIDAKYDN